MNKKTLSTLENITNDLNLEPTQLYNDDEWLEAITERVLWFLENDTSLLMSYLYRLDIAEEKIGQALIPKEKISTQTALAILILERQKQRVETKKKYRVSPLEDWEY